MSLPASAVLLVVALRSKAGVYTTCGFRDFQMMLGYFRVLCALVLVELVELILKFFDVHAVCNSPEVTLARNDSNYTGMTVEGCELFSNVYVHETFFESCVNIVCDGQRRYLVTACDGPRRYLVTATCALFARSCCRYDFCIEVTILALLSYAAWATFSNYRYMSGRDKAPPHVPVHVTVIQSVSDLDSEKSRHSVEIENGKRERDTKPTVGDSFEVALDSPDDDEGDEVDEEVGSV